MKKYLILSILALAFIAVATPKAHAHPIGEQCYNVYPALQVVQPDGNWFEVMVGYCPAEGGYTSWLVVNGYTMAQGSLAQMMTLLKEETGK